MKFPELSYADPSDPPLKKWTIRVLERLSGRNYFVPLYERWRVEDAPYKERAIGSMLRYIDVDLDIASGQWPPPSLSPELLDKPLVIVANHPYGILDGIAVLSLAEKLGRPFKVLIHKDLMKVPEIRPYCLPVNFEETREALAQNMETRRQALRDLADGHTIVIFPGGGVATADKPFGTARELPWKTFTAKLIQSSKASIIPMYFEGQCGPLFHIVSRFSLTMRTGLLISELRRQVESTLKVHIGDVVPFEGLTAQRDRLAMIKELYDRVHDLAPASALRRRRFRRPRFLQRRARRRAAAAASTGRDWKDAA
ncbi:MAG: lysophospholipid acyltransferase family protein [Pseudomonadota bacterium]